MWNDNEASKRSFAQNSDDITIFLVLTFLMKYYFCLKFQIRLLTERVSDQPESSVDRERIVEFSIPTWQVRHQFIVTENLKILKWLGLIFDA